MRKTLRVIGLCGCLAALLLLSSCGQEEGPAVTEDVILTPLPAAESEELEEEPVILLSDRISPYRDHKVSRIDERVLMIPLDYEPAPEPDGCDGDFRYTILEDGTAKLTEYTGNNTWLTLPEEVDGLPVTVVSMTFLPDKYNSSSGEYTSYIVTVPDGLTDLDLTPMIMSGNVWNIVVSENHPTLYVEDDVLIRKTDGLLVLYPRRRFATEYAIPEGVRTIGSYAFYGADMLEEVIIPDSVTSCGANPFRMCKVLTSVRISPDHPSLEMRDGVLINKADHRIVACLYTGQKETYTVPEDILEIGDGAFADCGRLKEVSFHAGMERIGKRAFVNCRNLGCVDTDVRIIDDGAFEDCLYTRSVRLTGVVSIGELAFNGCCLMTEISLPESLTSIGYGAFNSCVYLKSVRIPDNVTEMGKGIFHGCRRMTSATLPAGLAVLNNGTFCGCSALESVALPGSLKEIGQSAFEGCSSLTSLTLPDGLTAIGGAPFYRSGITKLLVPSGVTEIGENAFLRSSATIAMTDSFSSRGEASSYVTPCVVKGSYAEQYCLENDVEHVLIIVDPGPESAE